MEDKSVSLQEKMAEDLKSAMKQGEKLKRDTLRLLISQFKYARIEKAGELSPDDEVAVLMNAVKKRKEAIELYQKGGRQDLLEKEQKELEIISSYLPQQLSDDDLNTVVEQAIQKVDAKTIKDLGKVMSLIMEEMKGRVDGKKVQLLVRQKLG